MFARNLPRHLEQHRERMTSAKKSSPSCKSIATLVTVKSADGRSSARFTQAGVLWRAIGQDDRSREIGRVRCINVLRHGEQARMPIKQSLSLPRKSRQSENGSTAARSGLRPLGKRRPKFASIGPTLRRSAPKSLHPRTQVGRRMRSTDLYLARLEKEGLPSSEAGQTLLRRVSLDLTACLRRSKK